jgi:SAM-dependent methyltransferase
VKREHFDDPVAAYDRLGKNYAALCQRRDFYLRTVESCILERIPAGSRSLLDIGSGDGRRALRLASESRIKRVVLLEPSAGMTAEPIRQVEIWRFHAEEMNASLISERFDVITCLWNVLGHVPNAALRQHALTNVAHLLTQDGRFFVDINHRYNAAAYGTVPTLARWLRDRIFPGDQNGDVTAKWNLGQISISTYGHVFTDREIMQLASAAGLSLEKRVIINYESGRIRRFPFTGNLLYIFRRNSRIVSSSALQTS